MKYGVLILFLLSCNRIVFAQDLKKDIRQDWMQVFKDESEFKKDTLVFYRRDSNFVMDRAIYRLWNFYRNHYSWWERDDRNGGIVDPVGPFYARWKLKNIRTKWVLKSVVKKRGCCFKRVKVKYLLIPNYHSGVLEKMTLVKQQQ